MRCPTLAPFNLLKGYPLWKRKKSSSFSAEGLLIAVFFSTLTQEMYRTGLILARSITTVALPMMKILARVTK